MLVRIQTSESFQALELKKRYKVFFGGRGGAKSWAIAQELILTASRDKKRILCTREFQGSIQESVHKLLSDTIDRLDMYGLWEVQKNVISCTNGSQIIFEGLRNNTTKITKIIVSKTTHTK